MNSRVELTGVTWIKSSYSEGNAQCVEIAHLTGATWTKSSRSEGNGQCVEVAHLGDRMVALRDSKNQDDGPVMLFTGPQWRAFVNGTTGGTFDRP